MHTYVFRIAPDRDSFEVGLENEKEPNPRLRFPVNYVILTVRAPDIDSPYEGEIGYGGENWAISHFKTLASWGLIYCICRGPSLPLLYIERDRFTPRTLFQCLSLNKREFYFSVEADNAADAAEFRKDPFYREKRARREAGKAIRARIREELGEDGWDPDHLLDIPGTDPLALAVGTDGNGRKSVYLRKIIY